MNVPVKTQTLKAEPLEAETLRAETLRAEVLTAGPAARLRVFESFDGTRLFFRQWSGGEELEPTQRSLVLLHRGHEHGGRLAHLAGAFDQPGTTVYALDARGHGVTGRLRSNWAKHRRGETIATYVRDLDCFVRHLVHEDGIEVNDIAIVAQSMAAVVASAWVHDYAPQIRGLVLAAPAFDVDLRVPLARPALRAALALGLNPTVKSRVTAEELTGDVSRQRSYKEDPLIAHGIPAALLLDLQDTADRVIADAEAITVPTQVLIAGEDRVVRPRAMHRFFVNLGSAKKEQHTFVSRRHDLLGDRGRRQVIQTMQRFLDGCFENPEAPPDLTSADISGYTKTEADALRKALPLLSRRRLYWRVVKAATRFGALLSRGLRIGVETGFDSGATLDYVYRNKAEGWGLPGRVVDRLYLNAIGWRGIRRRKAHVEELIETALSRLEADGAPTHIADIAAGRGAYVLDALASRTKHPDSVRLRDFCASNVEAGAKRIANLKDVWFEQGDAFDGPALAGLNPAPTLAIVSGLYELFADNAKVRGSLDGLAQAIPEGGYLIYTGQPWHPQLEQIARTLNSHQGGNWVMRRRTQQELDQLVALAGFEKIEQRIDAHGIFTVSLARRVKGGAQ